MLAEAKRRDGTMRMVAILLEVRGMQRATHSVYVQANTGKNGLRKWLLFANRSAPVAALISTQANEPNVQYTRHDAPAMCAQSKSQK